MRRISVLARSRMPPRSRSPMTGRTSQTTAMKRLATKAWPSIATTAKKSICALSPVTIAAVTTTRSGFSRSAKPRMTTAIPDRTSMSPSAAETIGGGDEAQPGSVEHVVFDFDDFAGVAVDEDRVVAVAHPHIRVAGIFETIGRVVCDEEIRDQKRRRNPLADPEAAISKAARAHPGAHVEAVRGAERAVEMPKTGAAADLDVAMDGHVAVDVDIAV